MSSEDRIAQVSLQLTTVPPGTSTSIEAFGTTIAVFNVSGKLFAISNRCPHRGGPLCKGLVSGAHLPSEPFEYRYGLDDQVVTCPWHGWQFNLETGETLFDSRKRLRVYEARVEDEMIVLSDPLRSRTRKGALAV